MKCKKNMKWNQKIVSLLLVFAILFGITSEIDFSNFFRSITTSAATLNVTSNWNKKRASLGWCDENNNPTEKMWAATATPTTWINPTASGAAEQKSSLTSVGLRIDSVATYEDPSISNGVFSGTRAEDIVDPGPDKTYLSKKFTPQAYDRMIDSEHPEDFHLYYTIEHNNALDGDYRQYYVSTADQLAILLYCYQYNSSYVQASTSGANKDTTKAVKKIGIVLLDDIDLGGAADTHWCGYCNSSWVLEIDGQGHKIYNGYLSEPVAGHNSKGEATTTDFGVFLRSDQRFAIHDVTFSNMFIPHAQGLFGVSVQKAYFNNVNFEHSMAIGGTSTTIVLGNGYNYCYLKDCAIRECYIKGGGHCATFASYNAGLSVNRTASYLGDSASDINSYYYTSVPSLEETEYVWKGGVSSAIGETMASMYPSIYENCGALDCEIYDTGEHSGTFVSCMQSGIIFKKCFTNCNIFAENKTGVFLGCNIGSADGFYYNYNNKREFVNTYYEDCYASGAIEGKSDIGGFVGNVFNDSRADNSENRGKVIFHNCYSTSAVGMQYSGERVGGFVGNVVGNVSAANPEERNHIFNNCYAAGEVGGILTETNTTETATATIGGFFGTYGYFGADPKPEEDKVHYPASITLNNCYYDMQTTAMREQAIGKKATYSNNALDITLDDVPMGVYTQKSDSKNVPGLTDTVNMGDAWENEPEYYPQLTSLQRFNVSAPDGSSDLIQKMYAERAETYRNYSQASTATVFLDHYDKILDESGNEVKAASTVYDTVRDITRKFTFTSNGNVHWATDQAQNSSHGFVSKLGGDADDKGFTLYFDKGMGADNMYPKTYHPSVLTISNVNGVYKCLDFAPGKQWVAVLAGASDGDTSETATVGVRELRLLPTAYLNAGGIIKINVTEDKTTNTITNDITLGDGVTKAVKFNHSVGVAYALTDKNRMGDETIYGNQILTKYNPTSPANKNSFALYGGYLLTKENSSMVGLAEDGKMPEQKFENTGFSNNSTSGRTMVKVYKTIIKENDTTLYQGSEVIMDADTKAKWEGEKTFTSTDKGYYYMVYRWRLDDGRYLEDMKLVNITADSYNVQVVTGLLGQKHTVVDAADSFYKTYVDQYVSDQFKVENNQITGDGADRRFSSDDSGFEENTAASYYDTTSDFRYNTPREYNDGDTYYVKSKTLTTSSPNTIVGWRHQNDVMLTTLIVEAYSGGEWTEMMRVGENSISDDGTIDFSKAVYSHKFTSYMVVQDSETKLFSVSKKDVNDDDAAEITFTVESASVDATGSEQYIQFNFAKTEGDALVTDVQEDLRVTVLFRDVTAEIDGNKTVLLEPDDKQRNWAEDLRFQTKPEESGGTGGETVMNAQSLEDGEESKEVDNTLLNDLDSRRAVLSGDTLTYRVRLHNSGYDTSGAVTVTDMVPEGCTFIANSMKAYRQKKDITGGTIRYGSLEVFDAGTNTEEVTTDSGARKKLTWSIPQIELNYDYYVEFRVTVNDIGAATAYKTLTNQASWEFLAQSGEKTPYFTMTEENDYTTYHLTFQNPLDTTVTMVELNNHFSEGFHPPNYATLEKISADGTVTTISDKIPITESDGDLTTVGFSVNEDTVIDKQTNQTLGELALDPRESYRLTFTGIQQDAIGTVHVVSDTESHLVTEIRNRATVKYSYYDENNAYRDRSSTIVMVEELSNEVSTDVTWLYLNVEKTIDVDDPSQSFLMQIAYYPDGTTGEDGTANSPEEVFYTRVNCTEPQKDSTGKTTDYKGTQLVQCGKRGVYVVTEMDDWSATDYDFSKSTAVEIASGNYPEAAGLNTSMTASGNHVTIPLPRRMRDSGAFPTAMGVNMDAFPTAMFYNKESAYAYRSGQAYAENNIMQTTMTGGGT